MTAVGMFMAGVVCTLLALFVAAVALSFILPDELPEDDPAQDEPPRHL